jgi:hypothetical protein
MMRRMTRVLDVDVENLDFDHLNDEFVEFVDSSKNDFHVRTRRIRILRIRIDDLIERHNDEMLRLMNEEM